MEHNTEASPNLFEEHDFPRIFNVSISFQQERAHVVMTSHVCTCCWNRYKMVVIDTSLIYVTTDQREGLFLWARHNHDVVSNHGCFDCFLSRLFRHRSKNVSKLRVTGLCERNPPVICEFPSQRAQRASNAKYVSIWWRHHATSILFIYIHDGFWL